MLVFSNNTLLNMLKSSEAYQVKQKQRISQSEFPLVYCLEPIRTTKRASLMFHYYKRLSFAPIAHDFSSSQFSAQCLLFCYEFSSSVSILPCPCLPLPFSFFFWLYEAFFHLLNPSYLFILSSSLPSSHYASLYLSLPSLLASTSVHLSCSFSHIPILRLSLPYLHLPPCTFSRPNSRRFCLLLNLQPQFPILLYISQPYQLPLLFLVAFIIITIIIPAFPPFTTSAKCHLVIIYHYFSCTSDET